MKVQFIIISPEELFWENEGPLVSRSPIIEMHAPLQEGDAIKFNKQQINDMICKLTKEEIETLKKSGELPPKVSREDLKRYFDTMYVVSKYGGEDLRTIIFTDTGEEIYTYFLEIQ